MACVAKMEKCKYAGTVQYSHNLEMTLDENMNDFPFGRVHLDLVVISC